MSKSRRRKLTKEQQLLKVLAFISRINDMDTVLCIEDEIEAKRYELAENVSNEMSWESENYRNSLSFREVKTQKKNQTMVNSIPASSADIKEMTDAHSQELCYAAAYLGNLLDNYTLGSVEYNRVLRCITGISNTVFMLENLKSQEETQ